MDNLKTYRGAVLFLELSFLAFSGIKMSSLSLTIVELNFVFLFLYTLSMSDGLMKLYLLFFGLFVGSPIFLDLFGLIDIREFTVFLSLYFEEEVIKRSIWVYSLNLFTLLFVQVKIHKNFTPFLYFRYGSTAWVLALICLCCILPYYLQRINLVAEFGYEYLYRETYGSKGLVIAIFEQLFFAFSFIAVYSDSKNAKRRFFTTLGIYIILELLTGRRGLAISLLVVNLYFLYGLRNFKVLSLRAIIVFLLGAYLLQVIAVTRHGEVLESTVITSVVMFVVAQGTSFYLLPLAMKYDVEAQALTLFSDAVEPFWKLWKRLNDEQIGLSDVVNEIQYSGYLLADKVDTSIVANGRSWGTSAFLEFYLVFGVFGVCVFAFLIARYVSFGNDNRVVNAILLLVLPFLLYTVRSGWLSFIRLRWLTMLVVVFWCLLVGFGNSRSKGI